MRKNLLLLNFLLLLGFGNTLLADNFKISGKVSIVQESVPLPLYDVQIADAAGKYIVTVKTSFSGKYNHTFDIPAEEAVTFEVTVIDQCTGNALIETVEKEGSKVTIDFLVCNPEIITGEDEEDDDEPETTEDDDDEKNEGGFPDFFNCEALGLDVPVCSEDADGNSIEYANACAAIEDGVKFNQIKFCGGLPGGDNENGIGGAVNCGQLGIELPINVCVKDADGSELKLPICEALEAGYPLSQVEFCEGGIGDLGDIGELDEEDCEALGINVPVCAPDANGDLITYATPCEALAAGVELTSLTICNDIIGGGLGGFDCESLGLEVDIPVCTVNELGEQVELMLCEALTQGLDLEGLTLCNGALDDIDCSGLGIDLPVCVTDADGNDVKYDNPCDALAAGLGINELTFCDGLVDGILENLDCEALGVNADIPVCTVNEAGEQVELMLCEAITEGLDLDGVEICAGALDGIDCSQLPIDLPVCGVDADGNEYNYDNPCDALAAGLDLNEITVCGGLLEGALNGLDCESLGLEVDIPVCTTNEAGEQVELMLCEALTQGLNINGLDLCEGALDGVDCAGLGISLPVCTVDADGNELKFDNPCDALAAGIAINQISLCEGLVGDVLEDLDCESFDFDLPISVCVKNDLGEQVELNLCDALSQGFTPDNIEICDNVLDGIDADDCEGLGLNVPVCVVDADGNAQEFKNPCEALAAGFSVDQLSFCENLLQDAMAAAFGVTDTEEEEVIIERAELYPNPAHTSITLELNLVETKQFEVEISSINSNAIYRQKYNAKYGMNMTHLDVSSLSAGVYVIKVISGKEIKAMKFIKQ